MQSGQNRHAKIATWSAREARREWRGSMKIVFMDVGAGDVPGPSSCACYTMIETNSVDDGDDDGDDNGNDIQ